MGVPLATDRALGAYRRLLGYTRRYWPTFLAGVLFMVLLGLTEAGIPALMKPLLDGTFVARDPGHLFWMPILLVLLAVARGIAGVGSKTAFTWVSSKVVYDLREGMFERILLLPTRFYDRHSSGHVISKVIYDVNQVMGAASDALTVMVRDGVAVLGLLGYLIWLDWELSLTVLLLAPVIALVVHLAGRRLRGLNRRLQDQFGDLTHVLEESVQGHKVVKIYQGQGYELGRFLHLANWVRRLQFKISVTSAASVPAVEIFGAGVMATVIYLGTAATREDPLSVGAFVAFFTAITLIFPPIKRLTRLNDPIQRGLAAAESVFALMDEPPEPDQGALHLGRAEGHLRLEGVTFAYDPDQAPVLHRIDMEVRPRETLALVGPSGSGKSTIAALIPRLYDPVEGRLLLDGHDLRELRLADLRAQIALVSQDTILFNDTIAANIGYGMRPPPDQTALRRAAEAAGAMEFIARLPEGMETLIGENGLRLSGGQRQRLALARALLKQAPILILDEATSALDAASERHVQAALEGIRDQCTLIVIAHRLSTIRDADRILVLEQGRVVEEGDHQTLIRRGGAYARLYRTQGEAPPP